MISTQVAAAQATDQIEDRCLRLRARADSQDAWIFRAPVPPLATFDTELGRAKCDNRVAFVLGAAGYDLCGNQPVRRVHPTILDQVISRR